MRTIRTTPRHRLGLDAELAARRVRRRRWQWRPWRRKCSRPRPVLPARSAHPARPAHPAPVGASGAAGTPGGIGEQGNSLKWVITNETDVSVTAEPNTSYFVTNNSEVVVGDLAGRGATGPADTSRRLRPGWLEDRPEREADREAGA